MKIYYSKMNERRYTEEQLIDKYIDYKADALDQIDMENDPEWDDVTIEEAIEHFNKSGYELEEVT